MNNIKRIAFIEQMEKQECGMACLSMLMKYYDFNISLTELRCKYGIPKTGVSFQNMLKICEDYNINAGAYRIEKEDIVRIQEPCIIQWNKNTHFVILYKISKKQVRIIDPSIGEFQISLQEFLQKYNYNVFMIESKGIKIGTLKKRVSYNKAAELIKNNIELFSALFLFSIAIIVVGLIPTYILGKLIDQLLNENRIEAKDLYLATIIPILLLVLHYLKLQISVALNNRVEWGLLSNYMRRFLGAPIKFFENRNRGDLIGRFDMITQLSEFYTTELVTVVLNGVMILFYLYVLFSYSFILGSVIVLWNLISLLIIGLLINESYNLSKKTLLYRIDMKNLLTEEVTLAKSIKIHSLEYEQYDRWRRLFEKIVNIKRMSGKLRGGLTSILMAWQIAQTFIVFYMGSRYVINRTMSFGTLYFIIMISGMISEPLISICSVVLDYIDISTLFQRIEDTENTVAESVFSVEDNFRYKLYGKLSFKEVSFSYSSFEPNILNNISFEILPNEIAMIKGVSGVGKSTIIKLLLGIEKPSKGEIFIDDIPLEDFDKKVLRNSIAVISQEDTLFNTTILQNIVMDEEMDNEKFQRTLENTDLLKLLSELPEGENTPILENGNGFSKGQVQRILIARALYKNAPILIMDEATSSLDKKASDYIMNKIEQMNCTRIIITHHSSNVEFDKIFKIESDSISEKSVVK